MYWGFVAVGYLVTLSGIAIYAAALLRRGRTLSKRVPPERRRFLD